MRAVLETRELGRWYGQVVGLNELTLAIGGGITGLVGPNGAGKSTFLALATGEIRPSRGEIRVFGGDPFANRALQRRFGYAPQRDALEDELSGRQFVRFLARLSGASRAEARRRADRALERVGLGSEAHRRIRGYSKGMRQRVKLAQAIAHEPELLVLDEPLSGLDPLGRRATMALVRELAAGGTAVVVASHVLHEVEGWAERIVLLHRGRLLAQGGVGEVRALLARHPRRIELEAERSRELARELVVLPEVLSIRLEEENGRLGIETRDAGRFYERLTSLAAAGRFGLSRLESTDASLESVFDDLVGSSH